MAIEVPAKGRHFCVADGFVDESWKKFSKILVDTDEKMDEVIALIKQDRPAAIAFDTETTGKDFVKDNIVGCSIAWKLDVGYYFPFAHQVGESLDVSRFVDLWKVMHSTAQIIPAFNKRFDYRIARKTFHQLGLEFPEPLLCKMFEVAAITWNADTDRWGKRAALKVMAKDFLGWDLETFEKTLGAVTNLSLRTPEEVVQYASLDALILLHLMKKFRKLWQGRKLVVDIDDQMTTALIDIEDIPHPLDLEYCEHSYKANEEDSKKRLGGVKEAIVEKLIADSKYTLHLDGKKERYAWARAELMKNYSVNLDTINLNSAPVMTKVLGKALGIDTGTYTDKGAVSFSAKALEALEMQGVSDPILEKVIAYRQSLKNMGYLKKFIDEGQSGGIRCSYNTTKVTTGRLSASKSPGNSYFYSASIHTVKKAKQTMFLAVPGTQVLGYDFLDLVNEGTRQEPLWKTAEDGLVVGEDIHGTMVEGFIRDHRNVRRALCAQSGHLVVHVDYSAEEVRILGNLTGDRSLIRTFNETSTDVHSQTAIDLFGKVTPEKRKISKGINFLSSYGGSAYSLAIKVGISKTEAEMYLNKWWRVRSGVMAWKREMLEKATQTGFVETAFGRIRWVDYCLMSRDFKQRSLGERLCLNSPIQGTAGDMLRLVLARLHKNIWRKNKKDFQILSTVHDEVNFSVSKDRIVELVHMVEQEMDISLPGWKIKMIADFEVGPSWGEVYKFRFPKDGSDPCPIGEAV